MTILITGGAGFIGSHLVDYFLAKKHRVVVVDTFFHGFKKNVNHQAQLYQCDVRDKAALQLIFAKEQPAIVSHHAATITEQATLNNASGDTNVQGTTTLLEVCKTGSVNHFLLASSAAVYGEANSFPSSEQDPYQPINTYGKSKVAAENLVKKWSENQNIPSTILRYSNVYGPRQRSGVIATLLKRASQHQPLYISSDGTQTRDFIHVDDVILANERAISHNNPSTIFNIATGHETSILNVATLIKKLSGSPGQLVIKPGMEPGIKRSMLDAKKAAADLNWRSKITLHQGLKKMSANL